MGRRSREQVDTPLTRLTETLLRRRDDVTELLPANATGRAWQVLSYEGGPDFFDDQCIYDPIDDPTAGWVLDDFIDQRSDVSWTVNCELTKLLSKRGLLVQERMEPLICGILGDSVPYALYFLHLSYLAVAPNGESAALRLLDLVGSDSRDGLFLACYKLNTLPLYRKLCEKVCEWDSDPLDLWYAGTGEPWRLLSMLEKWDRTFPPEGHADVRRIVERHARGHR